MWQIFSKIKRLLTYTVNCSVVCKILLASQTLEFVKFYQCDRIYTRLVDVNAIKIISLPIYFLQWITPCKEEWTIKFVLSKVFVNFEEFNSYIKYPQLWSSTVENFFMFQTRRLSQICVKWRFGKREKKFSKWWHCLMSRIFCYSKFINLCYGKSPISRNAHWKWAKSILWNFPFWKIDTIYKYSK